MSKKGDRRRHNKSRNRKIRLNAHQLARVHKARKKLHKNPAFNPFGTIPQSIVDAACDMAVLQILRKFGVSSRSILDVIAPIVAELLDKQGMGTEIPLGMGLRMQLRKTDNQEEPPK